MDRAFDRTVSLLGEARFERLRKAHVLVVGLGGVGGAATEVLARSGIENLTLVDGDSFEPTNLNRQLLCTVSDIGRSKADAARSRVAEINPQAKVTAVALYVNAETLDSILSERFDYCIDAIDDIPNKTLLITECVRRGIPIISAMGAGNRLDCSFAVTDVFKTEYDPLARKLRKNLRDAGVTELDVVCATQPPAVKAGMPLSVAAPPLVMGAMLANHAIRSLAGE